MSYEELQKKARSLGLKHVGISKAELEKSVRSAEQKDAGAKIEPEKKSPESGKKPVETSPKFGKKPHEKSPESGMKPEEKLPEVKNKAKEEVEDAVEEEIGREAEPGIGEFASRMDRMGHLGGEALTTIGKRFRKAGDVCAKVAEPSVCFVRKTVVRGSKRIENYVTTARLECSMMNLRRKIRKVYAHIGGEICAQDQQGSKNISLDKGELKLLITRVRELEGKIEEAEDWLLELEAAK